MLLLYMWAKSNSRRIAILALLVWAYIVLLKIFPPLWVSSLWFEMPLQLFVFLLKLFHLFLKFLHSLIQSICILISFFFFRLWKSLNLRTIRRNQVRINSYREPVHAITGGNIVGEIKAHGTVFSTKLNIFIHWFKPNINSKYQRIFLSAISVN